ncbi:MAG: hypothetical protein FWD35_01615 [Oscillospiraceae bacterium]|nr:hypothetical protein [Oscillospiraceae bacterium]
MSDIHYIESLMNPDPFNLESTVNNFSFSVPQVVVDLDKNISDSDTEYLTNYSDSHAFCDESRSVSSVFNTDEHSATLINNNHNPIEQHSHTIYDYSDSSEQHTALEQQFVSEHHDNIVNDNTCFNTHSDSSTNISVVNETVHRQAAPVTVNFNAYNEFHTQSAGASSVDVSTIMDAFCTQLADAVTIAAEGVRL